MAKQGFINVGNFNLDSPALKIIQYSFLTISDSWNNPNRNAPYWRLYWNKTLGGEILFQGKTIELTPDRVILIAPHINYTSKQLSPFTQFYMHFEWNVNITSSEPLIFSSSPMIKLLNDVENWFEKGEEAFVIKMHTILLYYLSELLSNEEKLSLRVTDDRINKAIDLMNQDLTLNNREIAHKLNMSCDNYQRVFSKSVGTTACQYRLIRRMELAQQLLQNPAIKIDEIANKTGFANRYQFSKAFKQFFHYSPGKVRKKQ